MLVEVSTDSLPDMTMPDQMDELQEQQKVYHHDLPKVPGCPQCHLGAPLPM
jgi:hypothetical protein